MDGRSILLILQGKRWNDTDLGKRGIGFGYYNAKLALVQGWGYRVDRWKYVQGSASCKLHSCRKPQLYDLDTDLGERHDLADERPEILNDLKHRFLLWHKSVMESRRSESHCKTVDLEVLDQELKWTLTDQEVNI